MIWARFEPITPAQEADLERLQQLAREWNREAAEDDYSDFPEWLEKNHPALAKIYDVGPAGDVLLKQKADLPK